MKLAITNCPPSHAELIAVTLVNERLVACVNSFPVRSVYRWKDAVEKEEEVTLLMKVSADRIDDLRMRLRDLHPYELPEFVVVDVDLGASLPEYVGWVREVTRKV